MEREAASMKGGSAEVARLEPSSPSIRHEGSWDNPLAPTTLILPPSEQPVETSESSVTDSGSSEFTTATSTLESSSSTTSFFLPPELFKVL